MADKYSSKVIFCNSELNVREKIAFKDLNDAESLNTLPTGTVLTVDHWGQVEVHNPKSENIDYLVTVIVTPEGTKYKTSSESFFNGIDAIQDELTDAGETGAFDIKIVKRQSKNNSGSYITCALA